MVNRCGDTLLFETPPVIAAGAAVGGKKESEGPLAVEFDELCTDNRFGQSGWEAAEKYLQLRAARLCLQNGNWVQIRCSCDICVIPLWGSWTKATGKCFSTGC